MTAIGLEILTLGNYSYSRNSQTAGEIIGGKMEKQENGYTNGEINGIINGGINGVRCGDMDPGQFEAPWTEYTRRMDPEKYTKFAQCFQRLIEGTNVEEAASHGNRWDR